MDAKKTGKLIKDIRTEQGLTQQALAELLHVSPTAVSKWENGHSLPDISLLESISSVLGISISDIVIGERNTEHMANMQHEEEQDTAVRSVIRESIRQKRRQIIKWSAITALICAVIAAGSLFLTMIGFKSEQSAFNVRTEIQEGWNGNPEWVINFETKDGKSLYPYTEPITIPSEDGETSIEGRMIHLRTAPLLHLNPGSYTWGYSIEGGLAPTDNYDFHVIVDYADGQVTYSMREEGLFN